MTSLRCTPLAVPLRHPFVIATGRVDVTPNVLVTVEIRDRDSGRQAQGLGEAATLPGVTRETQGDVLASLTRALPRLPLAIDDTDSEAAWLQGLAGWWSDLALGPSARAGLDMAVADALARLLGVPLYRLLAPNAQPTTLTSDITLGIAEPALMVQQARAWAERGFTVFKVKVGRDLSADLRALRAICQAVPHATLRIDANAGYSAEQALALLAALRGMPLECLEQPCGAEDLEGLAAVTRAAPCPVLADESCHSLADVLDLAKAGAVHGVNLKIAKFASVRAAFAAGLVARQMGMPLMVGAMVETRLGIAAAAHLACALGGVEFPDLDTAFLLADDPFTGGYVAHGPELALTDMPGLGVTLR